MERHFVNWDKNTKVCRACMTELDLSRFGRKPNGVVRSRCRKCLAAARHPLLAIWGHMKSRCYNEKRGDYHRYGGRGILVCSEWQSFRPFYNWAMANGWKDELEMDRENNNGNYCPENCRFIPHLDNCRNKECNVNLALGGITKTIAEWSEVLNIKRSTLYGRWRKGWPDDKILSTTNYTTKRAL